MDFNNLIYDIVNIKQNSPSYGLAQYLGLVYVILLNNCRARGKDRIKNKAWTIISRNRRRFGQDGNNIFYYCYVET